MRRGGGGVRRLPGKAAGAMVKQKVKDSRSPATALRICGCCVILQAPLCFVCHEDDAVFKTKFLVHLPSLPLSLSPCLQ